MSFDQGDEDDSQCLEINNQGLEFSDASFKLTYESRSVREGKPDVVTQDSNDSSYESSNVTEAKFDKDNTISFSTVGYMTITDYLAQQD